MQKGSGSILRSTSSQIFAVSPASNDLVYMCPNLWCSNSKSILFFAGNVFFDFSMIFPRNTCFLCALCGYVTAFFFSAPKYTVQTPWRKIQVCPAFINVMIENNLSHNSGAKSTLYNVAIKVFPLLSHICIRTEPFCFSLTWCPSATSIYLSVSSNDPGMKSETSGFMWHVSPDSTHLNQAMFGRASLG